MRISDWSSDVCSSDLEVLIRGDCAVRDQHALVGQRAWNVDDAEEPRLHDQVGIVEHRTHPHGARLLVHPVLGEIERAFEGAVALVGRSEEHTSELQSLMRISYAVFCLKKKKTKAQI